MILHVDMDAFYASVEQRDQPQLQGQAVIVGGTPEGRGVVAAANYEARKAGLLEPTTRGKPNFDLTDKALRLVGDHLSEPEQER